MPEDIQKQVLKLNQQVVQLLNEGRYEAALPLAIQSRDMALEHLGENHPHFAHSLSNLAVIYSSMGNYTEAEPLYLQAIKIWGKALGEGHPNFAISLNNLAELYRTVKNYVKAEPLYLQAIEIWGKALDPNFAHGLSNLAELYSSMRNYTKAEPLCRQAMEIRRKYLGENHPDFALSLNNLAGLYRTVGNYAKAELLLRQAVDIWRKGLGENHPNYVISLNNLAELYRTVGNYAKAEPLYLQAIEIKRKTLGEYHPDFAGSLNQLALLYNSMGKFAEVEPLLRQAMEIDRKALGEDQPDFATHLTNLAFLYFSMGNYIEVELLCRQAMEIWRKASGEDSPSFATSLNNLALFYDRMGNYAKAEPLCRQAMEIRRKYLGEYHPDFALSLNNLAELYRTVGNYAKAEPLHLQAIEIKRKTSGEDSPSFATSLNNLALLYFSMGNYADAEPLLCQTMEIRLKALGKDHPDVALSLNNLGALYDRMGNYADAEPLLRQAIEIRRKTLGEDHPDFAQSLHNLGVLHKSMGNYTEAELLFRQTIEIIRKILGEDHPDFAQSLNNLAELYVATRREKEALTLMIKSASIDDRMIGQVFSIGSESQRMAYLKKVSVNFELFVSLVSQYLSASPAAIHSAFELVMRRKAIGAEALAAQRDAILGGKYPGLEPKLKELKALAMQIAQKALAGPGPEGLEAHQELLSQWQSRKEQIEAELAKQIPEMNLEQKLKGVDRQAISSALPDGVALMEFVRFDVFDFKAIPANGESQWKPARYLAFVMPFGDPDNVKMIDLGDARFIDKRIATFRSSVTGEAEDTGPDRTAAGTLPANAPMTDQSSRSEGFWSRLFGHSKRQEPEESKRDLGTAPVKPESRADTNSGIQLREAIFDKLLPALGNCKQLIISPAGEINRIPFEVLPSASGRFLVDDYRISYLGAGRDILRFGAKPTRQPAASLVIADPDFDLGDKGAGRAATKRGLPGRQSRDLDRSDLHFGRLPGTRVEGKNVSRMLGGESYFEGKALETRIKGYGSPRILHFATHGFFLSDEERDPNKEMRDLGATGFADAGGMGRLSGQNLENPLLRSGLALSGVNTWLKGGTPPPDAEDGLLTAEDVTGLDLLDTELVVLSACETGLGEVRIGEGVFGLRRSFVLAGARTLVMSLWKVPDRQTQELMEEFYRRVLAGEPRADALRKAQMSIRAGYPDPFYWGAFICQGEPGPLHAS